MTSTPSAGEDDIVARIRDGREEEKRMMNSVRSPGARLFSVAGIGKDYALVLPGFVLSLAAVVVLVPLFSLAVGTVIVWIGVFLLPLTLSVASWFAQVSRARARRWGLQLTAPVYAPRSPGLSGWLRRIGDPRRWLDLAFEGVIALPLRLFTFVVAVSWTAGALGGVTFGLWGVFLPDGGSGALGRLVSTVSGSAPPAWTSSFAADVAVHLVAGLVLLATLPPVMRVLALLDAVTTSAALTDTARDVAAPDSSTPAAARLTAPASAARSVGWSWVIGGVTAVAAVAVSWPVLSAVYGMHAALAMLVSLAQAAALLLAVRLPAAAIVVQTAAVVSAVAWSASAQDRPWPWPVTTIVFTSILTLMIALRRPWPWAIAVWALPQVGAVAASLAVGLGPMPAASGASLIVAGSITIGVAAIGVALRTTVRSRGALRAERRANADLSAQRRQLDERTRIAQELHDVVAHSLSVISVQATSAPFRHPSIEPGLAQEFASIAQSSRRALAEMRALLSLLRSADGDRETPLAPQPTLGDVPALVETTRQSGASIVLTISGYETAEERASVPPLAALAAYRIVQEALSNAVRHAPGADVAVVVCVEDDRIVVEVRNGAPDPQRVRAPAPGSGLGLSGAKERARTVGGVLEAGPSDGGFRVRAALPLV